MNFIFLDRSLIKVLPVLPVTSECSRFIVPLNLLAESKPESTLRTRVWEMEPIALQQFDAQIGRFPGK